MKLRTWQDQAIQLAIKKYRAGQNSFLVVATPGAGKTTMSAILTDKLFSLDLIDLVVCVTPSIAVKNGFYEDLTFFTGQSMNGGLGSKGCVMTYQSLCHLGDDFWDILQRNRVFIIFDEIHHCSGAVGSPGNAWGEVLIRDIREKAVYTLSLSGTPWRSDNFPIALANYDANGQIIADYVYGLETAIKDNVCRIPKIFAFDNSGIEVKENTSREVKKFNGIAHYLRDSDLPYKLLLDNEPLLEHILRRASTLLQKSQREYPDAAGLIVAASVKHAEKIYSVLTTKMGQNALMVNYQTADAQQVIESFKSSNTDWLISVGMVSEGTNIPRLQVCCHLSTIKTELHFRQVLGRVLRCRSQKQEYGYMLILAEDNLMKFAYRAEENLPADMAVVTKVSEPLSLQEISNSAAIYADDSFIDRQGTELGNPIFPLINLNEPSSYVAPLHKTAISEVKLFGDFMERLIQIKSC